MAISKQDTQALIDKIRSLPTGRIAEVEDFVDFLKMQMEQQAAARKIKKPLFFSCDQRRQVAGGLESAPRGLYGDNGR